ncbi:Hypothetical protein POVR1_LOCUS437 [uncultured virus]|nr:Hypothetical protein POVR1_LOCUS437 [uncultured virus]
MADLLDPQYDYTNPKKVGRGCWYVLLVITASVPQDETLRYFICKQIRNITYTYFKCLECRNHSASYLIANPPEDRMNEDGGLFNYVIDFMNDINKRLIRPLYDRNVLYQIFHSDNIRKEYTATLYDFAQYERIERGCWYGLLVMTATCPKTKELIQFVCKQIRQILYADAKCQELRTFSKPYLVSFPPEDRINEVDGLFNYLTDLIDPPDRKILYKIFHEEDYIRCYKGCEAHH